MSIVAGSDVCSVVSINGQAAVLAGSGVPCVSSMKTHIKIQWWFIGGIVVGLAGITFAIIKTAAGA